MPGLTKGKLKNTTEYDKLVKLYKKWSQGVHLSGLKASMNVANR